MENSEIKLLEKALDKMVELPEPSIITKLPIEHVMDAIPYSIKGCKGEC